MKRAWKRSTLIGLSTLAAAGCNPGAALWLQDYGRDILFSAGSLTAALYAVGVARDARDAANVAEELSQAAQEAADATFDELQAILDAPPVPGPQGPAGADGAQGAAGATGADGTDGTDGADGAAGPAGAAGADGAAGPAGADGAAGPQGEQGLQGPPGPEFFSIFVDQFFRRPPAVAERGGGSGGGDDDGPSFGAAIGWRALVPNRYTAGNPVTMRLFVLADFTPDAGRPTECEQFRLAFVRLRKDNPVELYGGERFILVDVPPLGPTNSVFLVIDLPLNTAGGLNLPNDLLAGQMLGVGMEWSDPECTNLGRDYRLFGVEFFETAVGEDEVSGATISLTQPACICGGGGN